MPIFLSSCRSAKTQPQKHPLSVWTAKTVPEGNSHDTRSRKPCSQSVLFSSTMNISAEHYRSCSHSPALCADYLYSRVSPAPDIQLVGQQYWNTSHTAMAYLRESQLHQGLQIQGRYASRQEMSYRYMWPPFMELPVFKNLWFFFVLTGTCAACGSFPLSINAPSDSISLFHLNKREYQRIWWSTHTAKPVPSLPADSAIPGEPCPISHAAIQARAVPLSGAVVALM